MPSSWHSVIDLLKVAKKAGVAREQVFRIVSSPRGLYYDWLNFVASMGGFDIIQSEGRLTQEVALDRKETIEATELFVHLAKLCGRSENMEAHNTEFGKNKLAMYAGWTDSFRFRRSRDSGLLSGITVKSSELNGGEMSEPRQDIRLARTPRDVRYPRSTLVDGWLMTFPKKGDESLRRALAFASRFLDPREQRRLLRKGFPSPSAWAIERELEQLAVERMVARNSKLPVAGHARAAAYRAEECFEVFLRTMELAIESGKWISSPKLAEGTEIETQISDALQSLINGERADILLPKLARRFRAAAVISNIQPEA